MNNDEIIKLFLFETLVCATQALQLMKYQTEKHAWSEAKWRAYYEVYSAYVIENCK